MNIQVLTLYTAQLEKQKHFYAKTMGFSLLSESNKELVFKVGNSKLKFIERAQHTPYHFAFTIPSHQEKEALAWLKERVMVLKMDNNEIHDFDNWNAKAIYFYDADHNIVEFIARKNLDYMATKAFGHTSVVELSEIGVPTTDIEKEYTFLHHELGLDIYDGGFTDFCAIGKETGLFICVNKNTKGWFPMNDKAHSSDFKLKLAIEKKVFEVEYKNENLSCIKK